MRDSGVTMKRFLESGEVLEKRRSEADHEMGNVKSTRPSQFLRAESG